VSHDGHIRRVPLRARDARAGSDARNARPACRLIRRDDREYPPVLLTIPSPPERLHVRGQLTEDDALAVAVVGSRQPTPYGVEMATRLGADLARRGVTVVSGLARGIDIAAHRGALRAGGRTIAVLGSGPDIVYPREHAADADAIAARGALVSPFEPGVPPRREHFPARNRLIAGLSLGVVVVEAAEKSGSLITAGMAGDLGREVMAVPGRVTSDKSRGTHGLIKDGATLVESWQDIIAGLPDRWRAAIRMPAVDDAPAGTGGAPAGRALDEDECGILRLIGDDLVTIEAVLAQSPLPTGRAAAALMRLEIAGRVRRLPGARLVRAGLGGEDGLR
jgi:DNA processing protein